MEVRRLPIIADDRRRDLKDAVRVLTRLRPYLPQLVDRATPDLRPGAAKLASWFCRLSAVAKARLIEVAA
jgi:hypothetical protein